jgi:hypothetical protein
MRLFVSFSKLICYKVFGLNRGANKGVVMKSLVIVFALTLSLPAFASLNPEATFSDINHCDNQSYLPNFINCLNSEGLQAGMPSFDQLLQEHPLGMHLSCQEAALAGLITDPDDCKMLVRLSLEGEEELMAGLCMLTTDPQAMRDTCLSDLSGFIQL